MNIWQGVLILLYSEYFYIIHEYLEGRFPTFPVAAVNVNARGHEGADDVRRRRASQPISAGCPAPHPRYSGRWAAGRAAVASEVRAAHSAHANVGNTRQESARLSERVGPHRGGGAFLNNCPQVRLANDGRQQVGSFGLRVPRRWAENLINISNFPKRLAHSIYVSAVCLLRVRVTWS